MDTHLNTYKNDSGFMKTHSYTNDRGFVDIHISKNVHHSHNITFHNYCQHPSLVKIGGLVEKELHNLYIPP